MSSQELSVEELRNGLTRDRTLEFLGVMSLQAGTLLFGFALGATWVGSSMTMAGCSGGFYAADSVCNILGGIETWTSYAAGAAVACLLVSMTAEYLREEDGEADSRTAVKSNREVTTNQ